MNALLPALTLLAAALAAAVALWLARREGGAQARAERLKQDLALLLQGQQGELLRIGSEVAALRTEQAQLLLERFQALSLQLGQGLGEGRRELDHRLGAFQQQQVQGQEALRASLEGRLEQLREALVTALAESRREQGARLDQVQAQVQERLTAIQVSNEARLEQMRLTVDEKLHATLEQRLGESFKQVSERLERVQQGLGEMRSLASDVGGLKRALTNVKTRGVLGEAQLGALLEQFLSPGQYGTNVRVRRGSPEHVEYAVKLPGPEEGEPVWLPIDAKFPIEDYQRLMEAYEAGDVDAIARWAQALEGRLMAQAREVRDKYVHPPATTDFALLFLPFEGLYAEALRRPGLLERVQRECRVTLVGPTTLTAFLNSLQVGFKTLAITRQSAEVWKTLGAVKTEFGKFGEALEAVKKKLDEAGTKLGDVSKRNELMQKKLVRVEALPEDQVPAALEGAGRENLA